MPLQQNFAKAEISNDVGFAEQGSSKNEFPAFMAGIKLQRVLSQRLQQQSSSQPQQQQQQQFYETASSGSVDPEIENACVEFGIAAEAIVRELNNNKNSRNPSAKFQHSFDKDDDDSTEHEGASLIAQLILNKKNNNNNHNNTQNDQSNQNRSSGSPKNNSLGRNGRAETSPHHLHLQQEAIFSALPDAHQQQQPTITAVRNSNANVVASAIHEEQVSSSSGTKRLLSKGMLHALITTRTTTEEENQFQA